MKIPSEKEAAKCLYYRRESKKGAPFSHEGHAFCMAIVSEYPEWYKATEEQVFEETLPFGAKQLNN